MTKTDDNPAPHVQAAFINAIREEGTKAEACDWLQKIWNEKCALAARLAEVEQERDQLLNDTAIHSDQRAKYEDLRTSILAGEASRQDAADAIRDLCRDNEKLAVRCGDLKARAAMLSEALRVHHEWHLNQDQDANAWGIDPVDAYSGSGLCERTVDALAHNATPDAPVNEAERLCEALIGAADDLDTAGRELAELENVLSRDRWRSEHAHQCAREARKVIFGATTTLHVNEAPKSEHDREDVLTDLARAGQEWDAARIDQPKGEAQ